VTFDCCTLADFLNENPLRFVPKLGIFKRLHNPKKGYFVLMGVGKILYTTLPDQQFICCEKADFADRKKRAKI
jgi:hypothetical protein